MNIAITGSEGFLGTHLTKSLMTSKHTISTFDRKKYDLLRGSSLETFVRGKDVVIHVAGVNRGDVDEMFGVNVSGTQQLAEAITKYSPGTKLIFISSVQVYLQKGFYGLTKRLAEETLQFYSHNKGLKVTILRLTNLYGPHAKPFYNCVIATFLEQILQNKPITLYGGGMQKRDFLYVADAVAAIEMAVSQSVEGFVSYDICSGKKYSLRKIIKILEKVTGKKAVIRSENGDQKDWVFTTKHKEAMKALSWKPATSIEQGIQNMISPYEHR